MGWLFSFGKLALCISLDLFSNVRNSLSLLLDSVPVHGGAGAKSL